MDHGAKEIWHPERESEGSLEFAKRFDLEKSSASLQDDA
jgi:hypothetical protein